MNAIGVDELADTGRTRIDPRHPKLALAMFLGVVPAMLFLQLGTALLLFAFVPAFDLAPVLVLLVARLSRRWRGVNQRWLGIARNLARVMLTEWTILISLLVIGGLNRWFDGIDGFVYLQLGLAIYVAESSVLVLLVGIASADSISGILRPRESLPSETS
jgi:hypothetical protein